MMNSESTHSWDVRTRRKGCHNRTEEALVKESPIIHRTKRRRPMRAQQQILKKPPGIPRGIDHSGFRFHIPPLHYCTRFMRQHVKFAPHTTRMAQIVFHRKEPKVQLNPVGKSRMKTVTR